MRDNSCLDCGGYKRPIKFTAFGWEYIMYTPFCQDCWENKVKQDALRLRAQFDSTRNDDRILVHTEER